MNENANFPDLGGGASYGAKSVDDLPPGVRFAPGNLIYFKFVDHVTQNACCVTLAGRLGHTKTVIEILSGMMHAAYEIPGPLRDATFRCPQSADN